MSEMGVEGALSGTVVDDESVVAGGGAVFSVFVVPSGGSNRVLSNVTCDKCGARWYLQAWAYNFNKLQMELSPRLVNHSSTGSFDNFVAAAFPTRRIPSRNTFVIGVWRPSRQT